MTARRTWVLWCMPAFATRFSYSVGAATGVEGRPRVQDERAAGRVGLSLALGVLVVLVLIGAIGARILSEPERTTIRLRVLSGDHADGMVIRVPLPTQLRSDVNASSALRFLQDEAPFVVIEGSELVITLSDEREQIVNVDYCSEGVHWGSDVGIVSTVNLSTDEWPSGLEVSLGIWKSGGCGDTCGGTSLFIYANAGGVKAHFRDSGCY